MKRRNLWAPWRYKYITGLDKPQADCFLCRYIDAPEKDTENLVLWRTRNSIVVFNKFPYNNGHLLVAPITHIADLSSASDEQMLELIKITTQCQFILTEAIKPCGFNVGMNFGRPAGAGLPGHMHIHIVPRWDGDTNFMHVCGGTDVISQGMTELYEQLKRISAEKNLPNL